MVRESIEREVEYTSRKIKKRSAVMLCSTAVSVSTYAHGKATNKHFVIKSEVKVEDALL